MTHLKQEQWLSTAGGGRVPALAFGTAGIAPGLTQRSLFSALQVSLPSERSFSAYSTTSVNFSFTGARVHLFSLGICTKSG